jgi:hypothetical protein
MKPEVYPNAQWAGYPSAVCRGDEVLKRLEVLELKPELQTLRIRATIADVVSLPGDLPELLKPRPFERIRLNESPFQIHVHYGGWNAVYYSLSVESCC